MAGPSAEPDWKRMAPQARAVSFHRTFFPYRRRPALLGEYGPGSGYGEKWSAEMRRATKILALYQQPWRYRLCCSDLHCAPWRFTSASGMVSMLGRTEGVFVEMENAGAVRCGKPSWTGWISTERL